MKAAIDKANDLAFVAAPDSLPQDPPSADPPNRVNDVSHKQGIRLHKREKVLTKDAARAAPVFNYARIWEWSSVVEAVAQAFEHADRKARRHIPVDSGKEWVHPDDKQSVIRRENRTGTISQVQAYCGFPIHGDEEPVQPVPSGMWTRIFIASVFALGLQWGATTSAVITVAFTPMKGLGCRSGTYILYGIISTMIWLALLSSSYLAHYAKMRRDRDVVLGSRLNSADLAEGLATLLRRLSILAAACNALGITLACVFQFSNFYSTCYCNSSALGRGGRRAYYIIATGHYNYSQMRGAWVGGVVLAGGCVALFLFFLHLTLEPSDDSNNH